MPTFLEKECFVIAVLEISKKDKTQIRNSELFLHDKVKQWWLYERDFTNELFDEKYQEWKKRPPTDTNHQMFECD